MSNARNNAAKLFNIDAPGNYESSIVTGEAAADGEITIRVDLGANAVADNEKDRAFHVQASLPDRAGSDERRELMAYSYTLETDHHGPFGGEIRGVKGIVKGNGGETNLRSAHFLTQGYAGHDGDLTGVLADVFRSDISPGAAAVGVRSCAFLGQVGAGVRDVFLARCRLNNGSSTYQTVDYIYRQESETINNPVLARTASFQAHGGGGGSLYRGLASHLDSSVVFDVKATGTAFAKSYSSHTQTAVADDTAFSVTPPKPDGMFSLFCETSTTQWLDGIFATATPALGARAIGSTTSVATGVLSGTTGTDGRLTVSAHTDGKIYVENRTGNVRNVIIHFITTT